MSVRLAEVEGGMIDGTSAAAAAPGEDDEDEAAQEQDGLEDGHALLEDDLIGQDGETAGQGDHFALGLIALGFEGDDGGLPDLVVLNAHGAQFGEDGVIEGVEEGVDARGLLLFHLDEGLLEEA